MDDLLIGRIARALRHRLGLRQSDVGVRAGTVQSKVSLIERGRLERVSLRDLRRLFRALDADVVVLVRWRGGDLDRLLDARHAALGEAMTSRLEQAGWQVVPEATYSEYGERGSIDLLGWHAPTGSLLVVELKSELTSIEETLRRHDAKVRLAPKIVAARNGWRPKAVARLLVLPNDRTARRRVKLHDRLFARAYPARNVQVRGWLRQPDKLATIGAGEPLSGLLFVPNSDLPRGMHDRLGRKRIRRPGKRAPPA